MEETSDDENYLPLKQGAYNLDFLDDNASLNPFESKCKLGQSPPGKSGFDENVNPFKTRSKLGSSPPQRNPADDNFNSLKSSSSLRRSPVPVNNENYKEQNGNLSEDDADNFLFGQKRYIEDEDFSDPMFDHGNENSEINDKDIRITTIGKAEDPAALLTHSDRELSYDSLEDDSRQDEITDDDVNIPYNKDDFEEDNSKRLQDDDDFKDAESNDETISEEGVLGLITAKTACNLDQEILQKAKPLPLNKYYDDSEEFDSLEEGDDIQKMADDTFKDAESHNENISEENVLGSMSEEMASQLDQEILQNFKPLPLNQNFNDFEEFDSQKEDGVQEMAEDPVRNIDDNDNNLECPGLDPKENIEYSETSDKQAEDDGMSPFGQSAEVQPLLNPDMASDIPDCFERVPQEILKNEDQNFTRLDVFENEKQQKTELGDDLLSSTTILNSPNLCEDSGLGDSIVTSGSEDLDKADDLKSVEDMESLPVTPDTLSDQNMTLSQKNDAGFEDDEDVQPEELAPGLSQVKTADNGEEHFSQNIFENACTAPEYSEENTAHDFISGAGKGSESLCEESKVLAFRGSCGELGGSEERSQAVFCGEQSEQINESVKDNSSEYPFVEEIISDKELDAMNLKSSCDPTEMECLNGSLHKEYSKELEDSGEGLEGVFNEEEILEPVGAFQDKTAYEKGLDKDFKVGMPLEADQLKVLNFKTPDEEFEDCVDSEDRSSEDRQCKIEKLAFDELLTTKNTLFGKGSEKENEFKSLFEELTAYNLQELTDKEQCKEFEASKEKGESIFRKEDGSVDEERLQFAFDDAILSKKGLEEGTKAASSFEEPAVGRLKWSCERELCEEFEDSIEIEDNFSEDEEAGFFQRSGFKRAVSEKSLEEEIKEVTSVEETAANYLKRLSDKELCGEFDDSDEEELVEIEKSVRKNKSLEGMNVEPLFEESADGCEQRLSDECYEEFEDVEESERIFGLEQQEEFKKSHDDISSSVSKEENAYKEILLEMKPESSFEESEENCLKGLPHGEFEDMHDIEEGLLDRIQQGESEKSAEGNGHHSVSEDGMVPGKKLETVNPENVIGNIENNCRQEPSLPLPKCENQVEEIEEVMSGLDINNTVMIAAEEHGELEYDRDSIEGTEDIVKGGLSPDVVNILGLLGKEVPGKQVGSSSVIAEATELDNNSDLEEFDLNRSDSLESKRLVGSERAQTAINRDDDSYHHHDDSFHDDDDSYHHHDDSFHDDDDDDACSESDSDLGSQLNREHTDLTGLNTEEPPKDESNQYLQPCNITVSQGEANIPTCVGEILGDGFELDEPDADKLLDTTSNQNSLSENNIQDITKIFSDGTKTSDPDVTDTTSSFAHNLGNKIGLRVSRNAEENINLTDLSPNKFIESAQELFAKGKNNNSPVNVPSVESSQMSVIGALVVGSQLIASAVIGPSAVCPPVYKSPYVNSPMLELGPLDRNRSISPQTPPPKSSPSLASYIPFSDENEACADSENNQKDPVSHPGTESRNNLVLCLPLRIYFRVFKVRNR